MSAADLDGIARAVLAALDDNRQRPPFTAEPGGLSLDDAVQAAARLRALRTARGERPVGRKIGFTNRNIWAEYGVYAPFWGDMYEHTVQTVAPGERIVVSHLPEPRIEPEIVLGVERDLTPSMSLDELAASIAWIAHGFEIVQSIYPAWRFAAADCIADGGLHGALFIGPKREVASGESANLAAGLSALKVVLLRGGEIVDRGVGANALDGPIQALGHLVEVLGRDPRNPGPRAGECVTTGTLTRAFPVTPGERWSTEIDGLGLPGMSVELA